MIFSRSIFLIALSTGNAIGAGWYQRVSSGNDKCSNPYEIFQSVAQPGAELDCSELKGQCEGDTPYFSSNTCLTGVPKTIPEQAKTGQWTQAKSYLKADCSSDPAMVIYYKVDVCFPATETQWSKFTCKGNQVIGYVCTDNKCSKCSEMGKAQTNFCNTTVDAASPYKASFSTCLNGGQQQQAGTNNSAAKIATFGIIPLISAVIVALF
jgi:hypothetical protein